MMHATALQRCAAAWARVDPRKRKGARSLARPGVTVPTASVSRLGALGSFTRIVVATSTRFKFVPER
eukprot:2332396-Rhodomonas_salina.1